MQDYDVILKILLQKSLQRLTGYQVTRWLSTELPKVQNLRLALLGETADGQLIQIEAQSTNDAGIPFRMLEYLVVATRIHGRVPKQILLYACRQPLQMASQFEWADGIARFTIIDLHEIDAEPLIASPEPSDNVLAILGRLGNSREALQRILKKLVGLPREDARFCFQALLVLAGLRGLAKTAQEKTQQTLSISELLTENEVLGPGLEEGRQEGERLLLRHLIEQRFGPLPPWFEERLASASLYDLKEISKRIFEARTFQDLSMWSG